MESPDVVHLGDELKPGFKELQAASEAEHERRQSLRRYSQGVGAHSKVGEK